MNRKVKNLKEIITNDTSNSLLDDPNNFLSDEIFEYLKEDILDIESREKLQKEFHAEKEIEEKLNYSSIIINSSQNQEDFDVYEYFGIYNDLYFQGKLGCVRLEWSKRMTTCAGIFYSKSNEYIIRLSEPLLKFRTIKEIKETLLHEMIHAWVQIENLDQSDDRGGHGYNFKLKMYEINKSTGFNITVYHTFHDEVDYYKTHVWRCNGECKNKHPYYGYVRRAMNRAPGKNDLWWDEHQKTCGGEFVKIEEPIKNINNLKENKMIKLSKENQENSKSQRENKKKKVVEESKTKPDYKKIDDFFIINKKY